MDLKMKRVSRPNKKHSTRLRSTSKDVDENYCSRLRDLSTSNKSLSLHKEAEAEIQSYRRQLKDTRDQLAVASTEIARLNLEKSTLDLSSVRDDSEVVEFCGKLLRTAGASKTDFRLQVGAGSDSFKQLETVLGELQGHINSQTVPHPIKSASNRKIDEAYDILQKSAGLFKSVVYRAEHKHTLEDENKALRAEVEALKLKDDQSSQYRVSIDKLKEQTGFLKRKLKQLAAEGSLRKLVDEQRTQLKALERDKSAVEAHVKVLQASLSDQGAVVEQLRAVISSFSVQSPPSFSKFESSIRYEANSLSLPLSCQQMTEPLSFTEDPFVESPEKNLQDEINELDLEIQQLQSSLGRALAQHS
jgi:hypothetical protein